MGCCIYSNLRECQLNWIWTECKPKQFVASKNSRRLMWSVFSFETWLNCELMKSQMKTENMCLLFLFSDDDCDDEKRRRRERLSTQTRSIHHTMCSVYAIFTDYSPSDIFKVYSALGIVVVRVKLMCLWKKENSIQLFSLALRSVQFSLFSVCRVLYVVNYVNSDIFKQKNKSFFEN